MIENESKKQSKIFNYQRSLFHWFHSVSFLNYWTDLNYVAVKCFFIQRRKISLKKGPYTSSIAQNSHQNWMQDASNNTRNNMAIQWVSKFQQRTAKRLGDIDNSSSLQSRFSNPSSIQNIFNKKIRIFFKIIYNNFIGGK